MSDIYSKRKRSDIMSKISSKNTKLEITFRKLLFAHGFRYRIHPKSMPGKPDIYLPKYRMAIFLNGCFWHGHEGCKSAKLPQTNRSFWNNKISENIERDKRVVKELEEENIETIIVWQCEISSKAKLNDKLQHVLSALYKHTH